MSDLFAVQNLLCKVSTLLKERQAVVKSGKTFNCLDICRIGDDEIRHSSIIATMLDPQGPHGLGSESLKAFFRVVCPDEPDFSNKCDDCSVETEYSIEHRRMDIVIRNRNLCVVIENKTTTIDHYMQLKDYYNWLNNQTVPLRRLFYLTYRGAVAADENIKSEEYFPISYERDICSWMLKCSHAAFERNLPVVETFCHQYCTYLKQITETSMTQKEMKELGSIILDNATSFKSAKAIAENFDQIRNAALIEFFDLWAKNHQTDFDSNNLADGGDLRLKCEHNDDLIFAFGFSSQKFRNFYYGIRWKDNRDHSIENFPPQDGWEQNNWFPYSKYFEGEFKNPDWDNDILFCEEKKNALRSEMNKALEEMKNLIAKIK